MAIKPSRETAAVEPVMARFKDQCPRCGEQHLFAGAFKLASACDKCGLDCSFAEDGDGSEVLVILVVVVAFALWVDVGDALPVWLHFLSWIPFAIASSLFSLRLNKGVLVTLQYRSRDANGRIDRS